MTMPPLPRNSSLGCQGVLLALVMIAGCLKNRWYRSGRRLPDKDFGAEGSEPRCAISA